MVLAGHICSQNIFGSIVRNCRLPPPPPTPPHTHTHCKKVKEISEGEGSLNLCSVLQVNSSVSHDGYLHFGDVLCIYNPSTETTLSANMAESKMHDEKRLVGPCDVSASKMIDPCIRNAFVIR